MLLFKTALNSHKLSQRDFSHKLSQRDFFFKILKTGKKMMATTSTSSPFIPSYLLSLTSSISNSRYPLPLTTLSSSIFRSSSRKNSSPKLFCYSQSAISRKGTFDPELRSVLELATDSELYEIESILFGPSYFSPLLKSIENKGSADFIMIEEDFEERNNFIELLESRFLYLGADARSTLRGWRPSYRDILLSVRRKLSIPCNSKLSTEDLEVEIFLHLLQEYSSDVALQHGLSQWKVQAFAALKIGAVELKSMILKGGGMLTLAKVYQLLARRLSGKMLFQAANYQVRHELIREGGKLAAINLESRAALLAAGQGLAGAASRYLGLRSMMMLLGPMLWGTFLADVVIQMLGTDYARILRAIYAFAQIRVTHTYKWETDKNRFA